MHHTISLDGTALSRLLKASQMCREYGDLVQARSFPDLASCPDPFPSLSFGFINHNLSLAPTYLSRGILYSKSLAWGGTQASGGFLELVSGQWA